MNPTLQQDTDRILFYIESLTRYFMRQMRHVIEVLLTGQPSPEKPASPALRYVDLERFAGEWHIPDNPAIKAALAAQLAEKYLLIEGEMPRVWEKLGLDTAEVQSTYQELFEKPIQTLFTPFTPDLVMPSPLTLHLSELRLQLLQDSLTRVFLPSGAPLFKEGEPANGLYVIASGRMKATVNGETVAERGRYDMVGEMALINEAPRTATLSAVRDTELWFVSKEMFEQIMTTQPKAAMQIMRMLSQRLEMITSGKRQPQTVYTIAVIPAANFANVQGFVLDLSQTLALYGSTLYLNSRRVDHQFEAGASQLPDGAFEEARLVGWLNEREIQHQFVIYEADTTLTEWTKRCIRQADRILLVGQAADTPALNPIETALFKTDEFNPAIHKELVLLHPNSDHYPSHTAPWLALRKLQNHHHVAMNRPDHVMRLTRFLMGRPVALVLSGGSVRAFGHIGVLRALTEAGIPVDAVCGTSAGSIIGAQIAMGWDSHMLEAQNADFFKDAKKLMDFTLPFTSFIAGKRLNHLLDKMVGQLQVEDLWLKYFSTSSDLTNFQIHRYEHGPLWRAIRASCSIPGLLPPLFENGHMLVDGGLTNNLPVSEMVSVIGSSTIILSNVVPEFYADDARFEVGDDLPFWKVLNGKLNPFSSKLVLPNIVEIIRRSAECNARSLQLQEINRADFYVRPMQDKVAFNDISQISNLVKLGYDITKARLADWQYEPIQGTLNHAQ